MDTQWLIAMLITGFLITSAVMCKAEAIALPYTIRDSKPMTPSSGTLRQVFQDMAQTPHPHLEEKDPNLIWTEYKEKLKSLVAYEFTNSVQIGLDRVKTTTQNREIVDVNSHLSPKQENIVSRGYGLEFRMKLD